MDMLMVPIGKNIGKIIREKFANCSKYGCTNASEVGGHIRLENECKKSILYRYVKNVIH